MSAAEHLKPHEEDRLLSLLPLHKFRDSRERREALFHLKCLRLAPDLETFEALLQGEKVPKSRLDPKWAKAYGY